MTETEANPPDADKHSYNDWRADDTPISLWDRVLDDDAAAWGKLLKVWTPCVYQLCQRKGIKGIDADEVVQEVMMQIFRYRENFSRKQEGHRLKAWLLTIIHQRINEYYRRFAAKNNAAGGSEMAGYIANQPESPLSIDDIDDSQECFDPGLWMAKTLDVIKEEVTPATWEVFKLFKIDGLTGKEVGEKFGISEGAVRVRVNSVVKKIRSEANGLFDENSAFLT